MVDYKELVEFIVKRLVTQPDDVEVKVETKEEKGVIKIQIRESGRGEQRSTLSGCWPKRQQSRPGRGLMLTSSRINY